MVIYMYYHSKLIISEIKKITNFVTTHAHFAVQKYPNSFSDQGLVDLIKLGKYS